VRSDIPVSFDGTAQPAQAGRIRLFAGCAATRSSPTRRRRPAPASSGPV
jgi:hypothetical protein